jgi:hypothetical protein
LRRESGGRRGRRRRRKRGEWREGMHEKLHRDEVVSRKYRGDEGGKSGPSHAHRAASGADAATSFIDSSSFFTAFATVSARHETRERSCRPERRDCQSRSIVRSAKGG